MGTVFSLPTRILMPAGNTLTDEPETVFNLGTPWPVKLTYKLKHLREAIIIGTQAL